jgi:tetratricopeptide (TPR) repeat protein
VSLVSVRAMNPQPPTRAGEPSAPAPTATSVAGARVTATGWRKWLYRLLAMTLVPALVFGLLEFTLRCAGFGDRTDFFLDGAPVGMPDTLTDNRVFNRRFFPASMAQTPPPVPFAIPAVKDPRTVRIFVLGESAAMGFPDPSSSFARVLEAMLRERYPHAHFEVINASMVAINSHVVRVIAAECAQHEPDLFVMLMGNNEVVGPFGAAGVLGAYAPSRWLIHASLGVKTTRTGQLLNRLVQCFGSEADHPRWIGMATFQHSHVRADDSRLRGLYQHFADNLQDICRAGMRAGATVIACTVPVNLQDCAPFASDHAPGLTDDQLTQWDRHYQAALRDEDRGRFAKAIGLLEQAAAIDADFADLQCLLGRCHLALHHGEEAYKHLARARDLDTLRFRCDTVLNDTIRRICADRQSEGIRLVDAEAAFAKASPSGIPGENLFLEHVHLNFKGSVLLAQTILPIVEEVLPAWMRAAAPDVVAIPTASECTDWLAQTEWNELKIATLLHDSILQRPPFTNQFDHVECRERWQQRIASLRKALEGDGLKRAIAVHQAAVARAPRDWMLRMNFGQLLTDAGESDAAIEQYEAALEALPHFFPAHGKIGYRLLSLGRVGPAIDRFRLALKQAPDYAEASLGLAEALAAQGRIDAAVAACAAPLQDPTERFKTLLFLGKLLAGHGRPDAARQRLTEAAQVAPEDAHVHALLGELATEQGHIDEAIGHYETALRLQPLWPELSARVEQLRKARAQEAPHVRN